jgi:hypothetical protein
MNHSIQYSAGLRGTISFADGGFVAAFRDDVNDRCPWRSKRPYSLDPFLNGMPAKLRPIADERTLRYLLEHHEGKVQPIITAAFWGTSESKSIQAAEPWIDVLSNGAKLVETYFLSDDEAYSAYDEYYELEESMMQLARELVEKRSKHDTVTLKATQVELLKRRAKGLDGLKACRESLAEIGIGME